jgi:NitT/TauT family transport system permease protein
MKFPRQLLPWLTAGVLLLVWQLLPSLLSEQQARVFPTPSTLWALLNDPQALTAGFPDAPSPWQLLGRFAWNTSWRVFAGVGIAVLLSYPAGLMIGLVAGVNQALLPVLRWFAALSPVAWLPLGMLLIANDNSLAVFLVVVSVAFSIAIATANSVSNVSGELVEAARILGASRMERLWRVVIPATLPESFFTVRLNLFAAWMAVLIAEVVGLQQQNWGLGSLVWQGRQSSNYAIVVLGMACLATLGLLADKFFLQIQQRFLWWRNTETNR